MSFPNKKLVVRLFRRTKRRVRLSRDGITGKSERTITELRRKLAGVEQKLKQDAATQGRKILTLEKTAKKAALSLHNLQEKNATLGRKLRELNDPSDAANPAYPSFALLERARDANAIRLTPEGDQGTRDFRKLVDDIFRFFRQSRVVDHTQLLSCLVPVRHGDFTRNALEQVEILLRLKDKTPARAYAYSLMDTPGMEMIGQACMVKIALSEQRVPFALSLYQSLGDGYVLEYLPEEWIVILAVTAPQDFLGRATELFAEEPRDRGFEFYFSLAKQAFTCGDSVLALRILAWLETGPIPDTLQSAFLNFRESLSRLIHARITGESDPASSASGTLRIGVLDYKNPDLLKTSRNVGDYIQTLAFLGNVIEAGTRNHCRWGAAATKIIGIAAPELLVTEASGPVVEFERLDRDFMSASHNAGKIWVVVYGWYMHPQFEHGFDFPFPPNLRPVFLSFHINRPEILTPSAIDYLKAHGPIGCRDWSTVYLLRDHQIEAFFSGCMTMTLNKIYQDQPRGKPATTAVALVDVPSKQAALIPTDGDASETITQELDAVRHTDFEGNLHQAKKLLDRYRNEFSAVHTSRLHCYLPCRAVGVPVEFVTKPGKENDIRFEGLIGITQSTFEATRDALQTKLAGLLDALIAGHPDEEIYRIWRELCRADLERAEEYCSSGQDDSPRFEGIPEMVAAILAGKQVIATASERPASWVEVSLALDRNQLAVLPNVLRSIVAHARSSVRFHLLARGLTADDLAPAGTCVAGRHEMILYPMDGVSYGENLTTLPHITISTMDRLLLPHILEDVDKILYLDTDILVRADVAELFRLDLGELPLAGRSSLSETWKNGYQLVYRAARALPAETAFAFRRLMHDFHGGLGFPCFNAGILVLNLDRMRRDDFCRRFLPWAERFRLNDQEILNCYCGFGRKELPAAWNSFPTQEVLENPCLVHWAGPLKPWSSSHTIFSDEWRGYSLTPAASQAREVTACGESASLIPLHLGKRHFLLNPATMKLEAAQQQLSTFTRPARHLQLLRNLKEHVVRLGLPADFSILSYGCSEGFECLDIRSVFPDAMIFGCDINESALECARERCPADITLFFSNDANLRLHGPYDVVVAFNVFCYYPETAGLDEIAGLYPIQMMVEGLHKLYEQLNPEGILGIYNSPYFIETTTLAPLLSALPNKEETDNGWIEKCDAAGRRLTDARFTFEGRSYSRSEWTAALRTPALKDRVIYSDYEAVECLQHPLGGGDLPGSIHTTFWSNQGSPGGGAESILQGSGNG